MVYSAKLDVNRLVPPVTYAQPPDYAQIKIASDERLKAEAATQEALRRAQEAQMGPASQNVVSRITEPVRVSGGCSDWVAATGIADAANALWLINKESGCNPYAVNPSSGACGVAQELPCGKSGCAWGDGACQVAWMNRYCLERYGSWANAVAFHRVNNWY